MSSLLKLGIQLSPRTVRKYLRTRQPGRPRGDLRWPTFLRSHARGIIACDFAVVVTATFRPLYVFIVNEHGSRRLVHGHVTAQNLDESIHNLGVQILRSPPRCPQADAICERLIGAIRRGCLDWLIPLSELHLHSILKSWIRHYNAGRPPMALGPGVPDPPAPFGANLKMASRHRRGESYWARAKSILGGLHHEYFMAAATA